MKYYIKVITGFREDQFVSIPMQEAHKAYYLFKNPDERGVFDNGVAIIGRNIQEIKPDYNATMGWYKNHELDEYDFKELKQKGVEEKMRDLIEKAKDVAKLVEDNPKILEQKLQDAILALPETTPQLNEGTKELSNKFQIIN